MFLDQKKFRFDNFLYMQIILEAFVVCETTKVLLIKYQIENPKNQMRFLIWFSSDDDGLFYLAIKSI